MEETLSRIVADMDELRPPMAPSSSLLHPPPPPPVPESTLSDLRRLVGAGDPDLVDRFFEDLASRNLPPSSLAQCIGSAMDSGGNPRLSLLASDVYLSLLLSPNAPVLSLFAPMAFVSLLHSVWKSVRSRQAAPEEDSGSSARAPAKSKRKGGRRGSGSRNLRRVGNDDVERVRLVRGFSSLCWRSWFW